MAVTAELLTKIKDYRNQGYTPDEIVQGLSQSETFPDVAKKVKAYAKGNFSADEILQGIQTSPIAKTDAAKLRSQFMAEQGGEDYTAQERRKFVAQTAEPVTRVKETAVDVGRSVANVMPTRKTLATLARPSLEAGGAVGGGIIGAAGGAAAGLGIGSIPAATVGGIAGASIGYASGKNLADQLEGTTANQTLPELGVQTLNDLGTGATMEMGGQLLAKGAGYALTKAGQAKAALRRATPAVTESGLKAKAGQIIADNSGTAPVYDQNAATAANVDIPGYRPSLGEARNDPGLIKLQRGIERQTGPAGTAILEKKAANQEAVRNYLQNEFTGNESIDDVISALGQKKAALESGSNQAAQLADTAKAALNPADAQTVGRGIADTVDDAIKPVKAAEREAWAKVPNYPIPSDNFDAAAEALKHTPLEADTAAAVNKILDYAGKLPRTTEGMQSIERTINDKMFAPNADPNVKRVLGQLKSAVSADFKAMGEAADAGDIALMEGKVVHPSKLKAELDTIGKRIADEQGKAAVTDVVGMRTALMKRGIPAMKQMAESDSSYTARLAKEYERAFDQPAPTIGAESKALPDLLKRHETLSKQLETLQPAEDVATAYRAAKDVSKERFDRFGKGAVSDITQQGNQASGRKLPDALIPGKVFTPDGADDFIKAVGKDAAAVHADQFAAHELLSKANPMTGELSPKVVAAWLNKNMGVLRKYGISGKYATVAKAQAQAEAAKVAEGEFNHSIAAKILGSDPDKAIAAAMQGNAGMHGGGVSAKNTGGIMQELVSNVNGNPQAVKGLQNAFKDFIVAKAETTAETISGDKIISPAAIQKTMAQYAPAMRVLYAKEPAKIAALQKVSKAVEIQSRSARSPIGGGSDTAENLNVAQSIIGKAVEMVPGVNAVARWGKVGLGALANLNASELNKVIAKALYDPELAQTLMLAARRYKPEVVERQINSHLATLGIVAVKNAIQPK